MAISLPRPDPASIWLAQQEAQRGQGRSSGVIIAVVALTALCIIGIAALLYFKFRGDASGAVPDPVSVTTAAAATLPATSSAAPAASATASAAATAAASAAPAAAGAAPAGSAASTGAAAVAPPKDAGFLTLSCDPRCDQVLIAGRSFVPPIVREPFPAGSLRVRATLGPMTKVISVVIVAGQVTPQKISMKK